ncbi:MAG: 50S ribosomal protein L15 [Sphingomonadales bacterium]
MRLNDLRNNAGATKNRTRVGRGIGSGKGRTGGRGMKGQKSRSGVAIKGFEGGQMPITRRLPKRGFVNIFRTTFSVANLGRIQKAIDDKKLSASKPVNKETLFEAGVIGSMKKDVKLLAKGELKTKITIEVFKASGAAITAVEKAGGSVKVLQTKKVEAKAEVKTEAPKAKEKPKAEKAEK